METHYVVGDDHASYGQRGCGVLPVADTTPYESVNKSEKLFSEDAVQTVKAVITDTKTVRLKDGAEFIQMHVETDHGTVPVHVGPTWYMTEYADRFDVNKGRSVRSSAVQVQFKGKRCWSRRNSLMKKGNNTCGFGTREAFQPGSAGRKLNSACLPRPAVPDSI